MEIEKEHMVFAQEIDISSGALPLSLLRQAVTNCGGRRLQDIGLSRDGDRVLLKLYWPEEKQSADEAGSE